MSSRVLGLVLCFVCAPVWARADSGAGLWLEATPETAAERQLREAIERGPFSGPDGAAEDLLKVGRDHSGTLAAGLARLAAGLHLLDAGKPQQALSVLRHADIQETSVSDHAIVAIAQGLADQGDAASAAATYLAASDVPGTPLMCRALLAGAEAYAEAELQPRALASFTRAVAACPDRAAEALLRIGEIHQALGEPAAAAQVWDRLQVEHPASGETASVARRLEPLRSHLPKLSPEAGTRRDFARTMARFDAGERRAIVTTLQRLVGASSLSPHERDLVRLRFGQALAASRRRSQARAQLAKVSQASPLAAEAAYRRARLERGKTRLRALESVARAFPSTPWGERSLFEAGNHFQKDRHYDKALPYYRRLLAGYPDGEYLERSTWYVGWGDFRARRFETAAQTFERTIATRPDGYFTAAFLYWAGRARWQLGQRQQADQLLREAARRFRHSYYGLQAAGIRALFGLPRDDDTTAGLPQRQPPEIPQPQRSRVRQLMLIARYDLARNELRGLEATPGVWSTIGWIEHRRGRHRPAITAMSRAFPEHISVAGNQLPKAVWKILYPLAYEKQLRALCKKRGLDPALVAALIRQESSFDTGAVSRAGARGLMQIMPGTGRNLARSLRMRYRRSALHDPAVNLEMGTEYLRQMIERFDGRLERAVAAYNAGPRRVKEWTAGRPNVVAEEFIETIPFTETRNYVKIILAARAEYRRIYSLGSPKAAGGAR